jgi:hypothetical protein
MLEPSSDEALLKVSKYAVLGFSPVEGHRLSEWWNLVLHKQAYAFGKEKLGELQARAVSFFSLGVLPEW